MRNVRLMLFLGIALSGICLAEESCPWMNAATAAGLLGGEVKFSITHSNENKDDANCAFTRGSSNLQVSVHTMSAPSRDFRKYMDACAGGSLPLKAIGNEAVTCPISSIGGGVGEQVIGRVRDRAFTIHISTMDHSTQSSLREEARKAAEQVAGNLF